MDSSNAGGVAAKYGFVYQDYVAALLTTEMLMDKHMRFVRCEVVDDIDVGWDDVIEFVQVKGAEDRSWTISAITANTDGAQTSLVHKQMKQVGIATGDHRFRIISAENPTKALDYLRIDRSIRPVKDGRDALIKSLNTKVKDYVAPRGNTVAQWVDRVWWEVIPSLREAELLALKNLRNAALEVVGVPLTSDRTAEAILSGILITLTKKSALSRRIYCEDDKTYHRENLLDWFRKEILFHEKHSYVHSKIYANKKTRPVLEVLSDIALPTGNACRSGKLLYQSYSLKSYRYKYIAESLCTWVEEVLLLPQEIADIANLSTKQKFQRLKERLSTSLKGLEDFVGNLLLHAAIRSNHLSQPIPAALYVDHPVGVRILNNVHIVQRGAKENELWIGFSHVYAGSDLSTCLADLREMLYRDVAGNIDPTRDRILEIKEDSYLLKHDVDEILDTTKAFDQYLKRYRFLLFFGYNSTLLTEPETRGHEGALIDQTNQLLADFAADLDTTRFDQINIEIYFYPVPNLNTLLSSVQHELEKYCA